MPKRSVKSTFSGYSYPRAPQDTVSTIDRQEELRYRIFGRERIDLWIFQHLHGNTIISGVTQTLKLKTIVLEVRSSQTFLFVVDYSDSIISWVQSEASLSAFRLAHVLKKTSICTHTVQQGLTFLTPQCLPHPTYVHKSLRRCHHSETYLTDPYSSSTCIYTYRHNRTTWTCLH